MKFTIEPQHHLFDESYSQKKAQLSTFIQLSSSQLFIAKFDESNHQYVALDDYLLSDKADWFKAQKELEKILPAQDFQSGKQSKLVISDALYTLVPTTLFDEENLSDYLIFNHTLNDPDQYKYHFDKLESFDAVIVYAIPRGLEFLLKAKLPAFQQYHFATPLLEALGLQQKTKEDFCIHIQKSRFDLIYIIDNKLHFFNSFAYESAEDFIYYLLYVMEQLQLDREKINLHLSGEIEKESSIYKLLYTYIRNIQFTKRTDHLRFSPVLKDLPDHYYFSLFNQHLCG